MSASFCWWCNGKLRNVRGPVPGVEITDQIGNKHRVHKCCRADAMREIKSATTTADIDIVDEARRGINKL